MLIIFFRYNTMTYVLPWKKYKSFFLKYYDQSKLLDQKCKLLHQTNSLYWGFLQIFNNIALCKRYTKVSYSNL